MKRGKNFRVASEVNKICDVEKQEFGALNRIELGWGCREVTQIGVPSGISRI